MIKIELQFETGAEARQALTELLGGTVVTMQKPEISIKDEKIAENFQEPKTENVNSEKPAEEIPATKKRKVTGKNLSEDKLAEKPAEQEVDIQSDNDQATVASQDNKAASAVTAVMLQNKALDLIRGGKKELVVAVIKKFGGDSISQAEKNPLKEEVYSDVMDELNKL